MATNMIILLSPTVWRRGSRKLGTLCLDLVRIPENKQLIVSLCCYSGLANFARAEDERAREPG